MEIRDIIARYIFDSRGNPTVEADVFLNDGSFGRAAVPSGASTGKYEAVELRDGGNDFKGLGVQKAVDAVEDEIKPSLIGKNASEQKLIDDIMRELDGTKNKSRLGANAILAVSLAVAHAAARSKGVLLYSHISDLYGSVEKSLPMPMMNLLNGGKHAIGGSDVQETMIIPVGANSMKEATKIGSEVFHALGSLLKERNQSTLVGDEGGYAPAFTEYIQSLEILSEAVGRAGYELGKDVCFALDVASSEIFENGTYNLAQEGRRFSPDELIDWYQGLVNKYPIVSIEDGLDEDSWDDWRSLNHRIGEKTQLVGDDFLVTNPERLEAAINANSANAILIKPNQIGSLTETLDTIRMAKNAGWETIISHRSGETEDITISHIAIGTAAGQIKTGSLSRTDRLAKYNEMLRLEQIDPSLKLNKLF